MQRCVAIRLKIPDNEAYTALTTLRRLGVEVQRVERADIRRFESGESERDLASRIEHNEALFNPNKHALTVLETCTPRAGEVWIEETDTGKITSWRLYDDRGVPASHEKVRAAADRLLCNPAIERSMLQL